MAICSGMCATALGSSCGGSMFSAAQSAWKRAVHLAVKSARLLPSACESRMVLSSTSVMLRTW